MTAGGCPVGGAGSGAVGSGDFLLGFRGSQVAFGSVVRERHGGVGDVAEVLGLDGVFRAYEHGLCRRSVMPTFG